MKAMRILKWIAGAMVLAAAIAISYRFDVSKPRLDEKAVRLAEDEVYEAVVRDTLVGATRVTELVFQDAVLTSRTPGMDLKSCERGARKDLALENSKLPYDSIADKVYRLLVRGAADDSIRADTIQNFLERSCTDGSISHTFHTDLPRTFVTDKRIEFNNGPRSKNGKSFEQLFPGANNIISFSHAGFDRKLDEAVVSVSFVCGGLCGLGARYVLKKHHGRWEVVNKWMVWVA